ncbi:MAG: DUF2018 family protein [Campylobacterales bacterium]|nr:DUF2018 family protein [Campylobacterales bacterium]
MNIFNEDDDFLVSTPKQNFFDISKNANQNIVEQEIEKIFERLVAAEKLLEEKGLEAELYSMMHQMKFNDSKEFEDRVNSIFLELVGNIVTQCE